jgi:hypothetical protein
MTKQDLIGKEVFVCDDPKTLRCITFEKVLGFDEDCIDCESQVYLYFCLPSEITPGDPRDWPWQNVEDLEG